MARVPAEDWRDAGAYAHLLDSDRPRFAWEWLRRNQDYHSAWERQDEECAAAFGLCRLESPFESLLARPMWRSDVCNSVLSADAVPGIEDLFGLASLGELASIYRQNAQEHLLLSDGLTDIRLDIVSGTLSRGPTHLCWHLSGLKNIEVRIRSLSYFIEVADRLQMPRQKRHVCAPRWIWALRVHDALAVGAPQRDIAAVMIGPHAAGPRWRIETPDARLRVQRLVKKVATMERGEWMNFLC